MMRMALAGPVLSVRDHKEFSGMREEKQQAFAASWMVMWGEAARIQLSLATAWLNPTTALSPWSLLEVATPVAHVQRPGALSPEGDGQRQAPGQDQVALSDTASTGMPRWRQTCQDALFDAVHTGHHLVAQERLLHN